MYMNTGYLKDTLIAPRTPLDQADTQNALKILCCGVYKIMNHPKLTTDRPHGRLDYQLLYFHSGQGHFFFDNHENETIVHAGQMVLFRPGEKQTYYYLSEDKPEVYWTHFTGFDIESMLNTYGIYKSDKIINSGVHMNYKDDFTNMILELQMCKSHYEQKLCLLLQNILLMTHRNRAGHGPESNIEKVILDAVKYFVENYNKNFVVSEYAREHYFSPYYFSKNFKTYTNYSPAQFIINLRINNAQTMLETFGYSINEIAQLVGYNDPLYFSRVFKKVVGCSPKEYRARTKTISPL